ncbi:DNA polymerase I [Clostridium cochlearium]|jgi:DNA polymerase-1|uniref:DNA polymerase I n=1 Tax=Clostridium cochlearium TaxID=1494 RepID=A0A240AQ24_CLOCO|nr:DNA polymerase I [Clostridium cochlearium]MBE6064690.1 DNA polymerase I [Clostridium cochlearium]MBU5268360.1 DNA polymerase I [Clostridium cochlearium]MCR1971672.1 DNA polymerase I [Clostridium cochlearium]NMA58799.1 DNA polymerase I [Clostridium cochlearium]NME94589.1 DNA polymerase I [Clostridium cochlearium]
MLQKDKLVILDGNSLMNRAFYALPPLTNHEGIHTNGIYGFINMLLKIKEDIKPDYIVCTFDKSAPTFRHEAYKDYKAGRKKMPEELAEQFPILKDLLSKLAIEIFEIEGFEADDLIGTLSKFAEEKNIEVYIVTGDKDALQLASDTTKILFTKRGITEREIYDRQKVIDEMGVTPQEFIDVKGLMGDPSDNIPGVPGIGEKTALKLIKEYGSVENVLNNIENLSGKKLKENLIENSEQAIFSKKLATIMRNVPIDMDLEKIKSKEEYDINGVREIFTKLQFKTLMDKILKGENTKDLENEEDVIYEEIHNIDGLFKLCYTIENSEDEKIYVNFKTTDTSLYSKIALEKLYILFKGSCYVINIKDIIEENKDKIVEFLKNIFEKNGSRIVGYDVKVPAIALKKLSVEFNIASFDLKIAAYLIDSSKSDYGLPILIQEYLNKIVKDDEEKEIREILLLEKLYVNLKEQITNLQMEKLYYEVELPLAFVLADMEVEGFKVDGKMLEDIGDKLQGEIEKVQKEIYELADEEFNVNSPKQLGKILFEKLDLPVIKKTKTGYSTNAQVLEALEDKHPIINKISYYRQLTKLYSTYVEGLKNVIDEDGRIHSSFNQTVTTTGRLSSTEPNLQNIPIKYEMGREIRKVFVPNYENSIILSADYSQIELRVLAHIADDRNLIDAFKHHADIHTKTASEVFKVPIEEVTETMRGNAKAVNFGIVYGIGDFSLAKDLKISRKEAKGYIDTYFERYPNVKKYMDETIDKAKKDMYVTTILNRRRFIPEIGNRNKIVKALGERLAMNTPIQGSAADIIKMAMVKVFNALKERNLKSKIILQVHDELILNVYKDELKEIESIVKDCMENVLPLSVPLEVDINKGENWYDAK